MNAIASVVMTKPKKRQNVVRKAERVEPTPETSLKLVPYFPRELAPELHQAAVQIEAAFRLITRTLLPKPCKVEQASRGHGEMTDAEAKLARHYQRWIRELERRHLPAEPVIAVVIDGIPPAEHDWRQHRERGWTAERVIEGLGLWHRVS